MKRLLSLVIVLGLCIFTLGCPSGEEEVPVDPAATPAVTTGGTPASSSTTRGKFKEGIDSGRAEDGSDEDK